MDRVDRGETVFLHPSGELLVGVPLFTRIVRPLDKMKGYHIGLQSDKPAAWILELGNRCNVFTTNVLNGLEKLGGL